MKAKNVCNEFDKNEHIEYRHEHNNTIKRLRRMDKKIDGY